MKSDADNRLILPNEVLFAEVERCLRDGCSVTLTAKGNSMFPFIMGGRDSVVLEPSVAFALKPGDIVLARLPQGAYVLHRIFSIQSREIVLMGDGNVHGREHCTPDEIVGVVRTILRKGRPVSSRDRWESRKVALWRRLLPLRRYLLFFFRMVYIRK